MKIRKESHSKFIIRWLNTYPDMSTADFILKTGSWKLASRISELRVKGHNIKTTIKDGIAYYSLITK